MVTHKGMQTKVRAKLVFRGVQEDKEPRADWPTLAKESLKVKMAIASNEGSQIRALDVRNAYLQGNRLKREI